MAKVSGLVLVGVALYLGFLGGAWFLGYHKGVADNRATQAEKKTQQTSEILTQFIARTQSLTAQADTTSRELAPHIAARAAADDQSNRETRHALKTTAAARVTCVLDANIMQQLTTARERATSAAANGITPRAGRSVSTAAGAGG